MGTKAIEIQNVISKDSLADDISNLYHSWNTARSEKIQEIKELRNYLFATDTTTTTNSSLPWKNKTTLPKLTQIRDIIHANYMNALFPNDRWLKWEGYSREAVEKDKRKAIEAYMDNKLREGGFINTISDLLYDYIDYGNSFGDIEFVKEYITDPETGEKTAGFIGPKIKRISIYDHVFNPLSPNYEDSPKITRYIKTIGDLEAEIRKNPELAEINSDIVNRLRNNRQALKAYSSNDIDKALGFLVDGFGSLTNYFESGYVEILQFEGNIYDNDTGKYLENREIYIVDRAYVIYNKQIKSWNGKSNKVHGGWRRRPDNLYAMGPLDNLVGMQYRIDHLENLKADAMDLAVHPPLAINNIDEDFDWEPGAIIYMGDEGNIQELGKSLQGVMQANNEIENLEWKMEEMAGAPRQAAGIRTPGEKTAFEVQSLENASGRIFQHKINQFEREIIEPLLNNMLEVAKRNMDTTDVIRVMDDDLGVTSFIEITKEDITAKGKLRPIGSRHFSANAQLMQNITQLASTGLFQQPAFVTHFSFKNMAKLVENLLTGIEKYDIVSDNALVYEQTETQKIMQEASEQLELEQTEEVGIEEPMV